MNRPTLNTKRQLLADLFDGKTDSLRTYRANQQRATSPYRWILSDEVAGTICGIGQDGSQHPLTTDDLAKTPHNTIWRIIDHSGGHYIPAPDED